MMNGALVMQNKQPIYLNLSYSSSYWTAKYTAMWTIQVTKLIEYTELILLKKLK